ncbi:MAG: undecaprenyl/decaprenyl-phosphate alpha-N-acetylglucosaminyl 1-phosphate transferase [Bacteroidia bacterium]|nr:undecaprenyl/decaprenyl-phosphate alpha-N-acetylglucosaminyl 1-phosphate transferase [Bacteroidia bacterium]
MSLLILVFFTSFFIVLLATPSLIKVAFLKNLIDLPSERKIHTRAVPTIGGIIIYAATLFSFSLWYNIDSLSDFNQVYESVKEFKILIATSLVLFFVGVKDDIIGTAPMKKLFANIVVGLILILIGGIRITGLHGVFGLEEIPQWASIFLSLFTYIVVVNAMNLIDGVDGLAAGVGFIVTTVLGTWFIFANNYEMASLSFSLSGALLGFLLFNFYPAKIFMGDSGSLIIGMLICVLSIKLIEYPIAQLDDFWVKISKPVFVIATLTYPLTDTLRVFIIRTMKGLSPFSADRNHLHHRLLDCGFSQTKTVCIIYLYSILTVGASLLSYFLSPSLALGAVIICSGLFIGMVSLRYKSSLKKKQNNGSV